MDCAKGRIKWVGGQLCLEMVTPESTFFNLYAAPFLQMMKSPGQGAKVKSRNNNPTVVVGYYGGDIGGILRSKGTMFVITLYFGNITGVYNRLNYDADARTFKHVRFIQEYWFPKTELKAYRHAISIMYGQALEFDGMKIAAGTAPDFTCH